MSYALQMKQSINHMKKVMDDIITLTQTTKTKSFQTYVHERILKFSGGISFGLGQRRL